MGTTITDFYYSQSQYYIMFALEDENINELALLINIYNGDKTGITASLPGL